MNKNKIIPITLTAIVVFFILVMKKGFLKPTKSGKIRGCDQQGCGYFGASRGNRLHMGVDFVAPPGEAIFAPISGKITAIPYASSDHIYKGIEISTGSEVHQLFYIIPAVSVNTFVKKGQLIGHADSLSKKYGNITNHVHHEVTQNGKFINPTSLYI